MDLQTFSMIMMTWFIASFAFGLLLGRMLGELNRLDEQMRGMGDEGPALLPAPYMLLPSWAATREASAVTA